jgi:valyl-tRNA synthetase
LSQAEIPKTYDPKAVEARIYEEWERSGAFEADPDSEKEPYCIVLPPPNVTGALHMGHALNGAIQDTLVRRARMKGYEALWLPGVDHASIGLHNVVERKLMREEGKTRFDIGRERFVELCREFAEESRGQILGQLRKLGASVDWRRLRYTMDDGYVDAVLTAFVELFDQGLVYRGNRITNWCPHDRSAISDLEVNYEEVEGKLYGIRYPFSDGKGPGPDGNPYAQVFSTRPETMLGDVALVVNPDDERYTGLVGRRVTVPFVEREIEVLADEYVNPSFGTGVLKVTPAHDPNDFEIAKRHDLPAVNVLNPDGTINENGAQFEGMSREAARNAIVEGLDEKGLLGEVRPHRYRLGHCDRCGSVVEPWLSEQWWISMQELAAPAIEALKHKEITVHPDSWRRETIRWLENLQDWNVSRQLWWGHRIPVWYGPDGEVVASKESPGEGWEQDPDILDTWFSSGLWPFATLGWPEETEDLRYFYSTSLLSTAREIMYLWVARMIMMGLRFRGDVPFRKVNVHSIVLAEDGTKMSKSKGNTINPLYLFDEYGTDAVRFGLLYQSSTQDFSYSYERAALGRGFVTKLWNMARFVSGYPTEGDSGARGNGARGSASKETSASDRWILSSFNETVREYDRLLEECEFSEAMRVVYDFAWRQFADWYVEISKAAPSKQTTRVLREVFDGTLRLLHPPMPFATEEMYGGLGGEGLLINQEFPRFDPALEDAEAERLLERTRLAVSAVRSFRADSGIDGELAGKAPEGVDLEVFSALAGVRIVEDLDGSARATLPAGDVVVELALSEELRREEVERLRKEISRVEGEVRRAEGKLSNKNFVERAPAAVVASEREKLDRNAGLVETLKTRLDEYL